MSPLLVSVDGAVWISVGVLIRAALAWQLDDDNPLATVVRVVEAITVRSFEKFLFSSFSWLILHFSCCIIR